MSNDKQLLTVGQMIESVTNRLVTEDVYFGHGTDNASDEAFALVFQVLRFPFNDRVEDRLNDVLTLDQQNQVLRVLDRRITEKKPLPYLVNEAYFAGLPFYVDERVIIPRSSMAELIEQANMPWIDQKEVHSILDLCTGSGCLAIACASVFPDAEIDAVDLSQDALDVAKINVDRYQVGNRVHLIQSDLFKEVDDKSYDIIISNPPYVGQEEMQTLPEEYLHEPQMALLAKDEGLSVVIQILRSSVDYLTEQGILIVEVGNSQAILEKRFPNIPFLWLEFERSEGGVFLLTKEQLTRVERLS